MDPRAPAACVHLRGKDRTMALVISFKISETAKAAIDAMANDRGLAPALLCRTIVLREVGAMAEQPRVTRRIANRDLLRDALGELGRHGSLLNQIARKLNGGGSAVAAASDLTSMRVSYDAALRVLTTAVGAGDNP